jgi:hypothetical protein
MTQPTGKLRIWVDFHNSDALGRVRLNTVGTIQSLNSAGIVLATGLEATFYCLEREQDGKVTYSPDEDLWVGSLDGISREFQND